MGNQVLFLVLHVGPFKRMSLRCELVNLKKLNATSISPEAEAFQNSILHWSSQIGLF